MEMPRKNNRVVVLNGFKSRNLTFLLASCPIINTVQIAGNISQGQTGNKEQC